MSTVYHFEMLEKSTGALAFEKEWQASLLAPQDGMWESFRKSSVYWLIKKKNKTIGYYNLHEAFGLIQFYIQPDFKSEGKAVFDQLLKTNKINKAIVGTNNPMFEKIANEFCKDKAVHTLLFESHEDVRLEEKQGTFRLSKVIDLEPIVKFTTTSIDAPEAWVKTYTLGLIHKEEHFLLEWNQEIIGISEVRKSTTQKGIADIGMIVHPKYRKMGYGTYLLNKGKSKAIENKLHPICSCEANNVGSLKSIQNCGFQSNHQLLKMTF